MFQFVFGNLFPRYFSRIDDYGVQSRLEVDNLYQTYQTQKNFWWYATPQKNTEIVVKTEQVDEAKEFIEIKDSTDVKIEPDEMVDATATTSDVKPEVKKKKKKSDCSRRKEG